LLPPKILFHAVKRDFDDLIFDAIGHVRYDGRKSDQILRDCPGLIEDYGGKLSRLEAAASDSADLEVRIGAFYGVGPVTGNIFLRELRPYWGKADPDPLPVVLVAAKRLNVELSRYDRKSLTFARVEAGLIRLRRKLASGTHPT
jgi:hypothetical protein